MKTIHKTVACLCIFSILFLGCYSSTLINPAGAEKDRMYTDTIDYVVAKDGTKYEFAESPAIVKDAIVGEVRIRVTEGIMTKQVSIPLSDIEKVGVSEFSASKTILLGVGIAAIVALIWTALLSHDMYEGINSLK